MSGWKILIFATVSLWGGIVFLSLAANAVALASCNLRALEARERRRKRREQGQEVAFVAEPAVLENDADAA